MHLHKITIISGITLWAHFSQSIAKFDTLSNLLLTLGNNGYKILMPFYNQICAHGCCTLTNTCQVCACACVRTCACLYVRACVCICLCLCVYVHTCVYVCAYVCVCVCMMCGHACTYVCLSGCLSAPQGIYVNKAFLSTISLLYK